MKEFMAVQLWNMFRITLWCIQTHWKSELHYISCPGHIQDMNALMIIMLWWGSVHDVEICRCMQAV